MCIGVTITLPRNIYLATYISVARVHPSTSKGITDLLLAPTSDTFWVAVSLRSVDYQP